jgi:putative FmdB family regulatory protein
MPIYEYRCSSCGHQQEFIQKVSDAPIVVCTECGKPDFVKMLTAAGFQLKGSGWYATDFRNPAAAPAKESATKGAANASAGDSKGEAKTETQGEPKSAAKKEAPSESESKSKSESKGEAKSEGGSKGAGPSTPSGGAGGSSC